MTSWRGLAPRSQLSGGNPTPYSQSRLACKHACKHSRHSRREPACSTVGPLLPIGPVMRAWSPQSEVIGWNRPRDADNPVFLQYFFDQETTAYVCAVADLACLMFVVETADELGTEAPIIRLHEQRPTAGVLLQQLDPLLREGRFEPVEDRVGSHSALCHDVTLPQRTTHRDIAVGADSLRLTTMDFGLWADQVAMAVLFE